MRRAVSTDRSDEWGEFEPAIIAGCARLPLLTPALLIVDGPVAQVRGGWPWLLYLGGVATAGAYALYSRGLTAVPASIAGTITLLEPLTATLLGVVIFGERLGLRGGAGAVLLLAALVLLTTHAISAVSLDREGATRTAR